jgi:murein DD-endopeptidase MepM/ murein hydrolase activator NlpD
MHHTRRLLIVIPLAMALLPVVPFAMTGLVSIDERERTRESLQDAIGDAASEYRQRGGLQSRLEKGQTTLSEQERLLEDVEKKKVLARAEVVKLRRIRATIERRTGADLPTLDAAKTVLAAAKKRYADLLRQRADARGAFTPWSSNAPWSLADERLLRYQRGLVEDLTAGTSVLERLARAEGERDKTLTLYAQASKKYAETAGLVAMSEEQLRENRRIMADVHAQVLSLQGELARIDARLRSKAGRALVEKGILAADDVRHAAAAGSQTFSWPVYGQVSAGFKNKAYVGRFGVQHYGADIVVPQGTPVGAAADGVVFLVRDGGKTGYTYILIGHRDGYATLYGHLFETHVQSGQDVVAGQAIGLSGGKPGTHGAGPMTTASHLHFEVIQNGVNVDPLSVLP